MKCSRVHVTYDPLPIIKSSVFAVVFMAAYMGLRQIAVYRAIVAEPVDTVGVGANPLGIDVHLTR